MNIPSLHDPVYPLRLAATAALVVCMLTACKKPDDHMAGADASPAATPAEQAPPPADSAPPASAPAPEPAATPTTPPADSGKDVDQRTPQQPASKP